MNALEPAECRRIGTRRSEVRTGRRSREAELSGEGEGRRSEESFRSSGAYRSLKSRKRRGGLPPRGFTGHCNGNFRLSEYAMSQISAGADIQRIDGDLGIELIDEIYQLEPVQTLTLVVIPHSVGSIASESTRRE